MESANQSSSSKWDYMLTCHKATVEMLTLANENVLEEYTKVSQASEKKISESTTTVKKLHQEMKDFMSDFPKILLQQHNVYE